MNIIKTIDKYLMESKNSSKVAIINAMEIYFDYMGDDPIYNKQSEMDKGENIIIKWIDKNLTKSILDEKDYSKKVTKIKIMLNKIKKEKIKNKHLEIFKEMLSDKTKKEYFAEELATPDKI